ncbi:MAG: DegT/DnrJ/EryC1/StrS family aminotransferase [Mariprofundaceae bacterium]|nr:DegT/DnrJ/EryC1/StrS family aminotransferase [Mariprofundaceae bacterium]
MIPHSRPVFNAQSLRAVQQVVQQGHTARGLLSEALETRVARLVGKKHGAAIDSGTSALMLALFALQRDAPVRRVGIPAYACRALFFAVRASGAEPVMMDCDADLRLHATQARALASALDAVILVHPFGMIEPMVAEKWPCPVIEDIAQAAGGHLQTSENLQGGELGGFGDVSIASFYATKPWGGAYGGMLLSDCDALHQRVCRMRYADAADVSLPYAGNHQLSDVHAALAMDHLERADGERQARVQLAELYDDWISPLDGEPVRRDAAGNHYRYIVRVEDADRLIAALCEQEVAAACPVEVPLSRLLDEHCPGAEAARRQCVSLPLLADLADQEKEIMHKALQICM